MFFLCKNIRQKLGIILFSIDSVKQLIGRAGELWKFIEGDEKTRRQKELDSQTHDPEFWSDPGLAKKIIDEINLLKSWTEPLILLTQSLNDLLELAPEAIELDDQDLLQELENNFMESNKKLEELEMKKMLSGELDASNCYLSINAGAGGTESCDWVSILARMYERWIQSKGWNFSIIDQQDGEVAGIKSITYFITGQFGYGYAKAEKGVHRLVRISPFDSNARRHTSFAAVEVTPEIDQDIEIEIRPDELRIETFRASGAGGQHVNTTDSAVRMVHLPTGIVAACQAERSQLQNRETCMKMLKAKLYEKQMLEHQEKIKDIQGEKSDNAWGSQIRNYVFHPYNLVKDTRTGVETGNVKAVMDGQIDLFVEAYLKALQTSK